MMRSLTAVTAALVLLAGCASSPTRSTSQPSANRTSSVEDGTGKTGNGPSNGYPIQPGDGMATAVPSTTCPKEVFGGLSYGAGEKVTSAWHISWVLRCTSTQKTYPGDGVWTVVTTERADGSPDALLAQLRKADLPVPSGIACPAIAMFIPWFVLVDTSGKPHFAHIPTGQCGQPIGDAITALNALPWHVMKTERTTRIQSQLSLDTGCPDQYKDVIAITMAGPSLPPQPVPAPVPDDSTVVSKGSGTVAVPPVPQPQPAVSASGGGVSGGGVSGGGVSGGGGSAGSGGVGAATAGSASANPGTVVTVEPPGTATPPSPPAPHVCVYTSKGDVGTLVSGRALTTAELAAVIKGLTGAPHPCGIHHSRFAVLTGSDRGEYWIELDGCTRALSPDQTVTQASAAALAILTR